jgi:hypothetical protein
MKLGKLIGRIGFVVGFLGPVLFYSSPFRVLYESHVVCPVCPYLEIPFATKLTWVGVGLWLGLVFGLVYAPIGFGIGWSIFKLRAFVARRPEA